MPAFKKMTLVADDSNDGDYFQTGGSHPDVDMVDSVIPSPPVQQQQPGQRKGNTIRDHAMERQRRLLQIIMRIAAIRGYNENGNIKDRHGKFIEGTDIIPLILYSVTKERLVRGIDAYVDLLVEAKVPPDVITNENLKQRLINAGHASRPKMSEAAIQANNDVQLSTVQLEPTSIPSTTDSTTPKSRRTRVKRPPPPPSDRQTRSSAPTKRKNNDDDEGEEDEVAAKLMKGSGYKRKNNTYEYVTDSEDE